VRPGRDGVLPCCERDMPTATRHRIVLPFTPGECARETLGLADGKLWTSRGLAHPA